MKQFNFILTILTLVMITSCKEFPDLGYGYKFDYNSSGDLGIINSKNSYLIYGHILKYTFDSTFIIVAERPRDSIVECTGTISGMTLNKCNEAFNKSTFRQYWIINKRNESIFDQISNKYTNVYGPFNRNEYIKKREELQVPKQLLLNENK